MENITITMTATTPDFGLPMSGSAHAAQFCPKRSWVQALVAGVGVIGARIEGALDRATTRGFAGDLAWRPLTS